MVLCTLVTYFSLYYLHALHWTIVAMLLISQSLGAHWYLPQPRTFKWCQCVKAGGCICILLMHDTASQCLFSIPLPFSLAMFSISLSLHWIIVNCPLSKPSYSLTVADAKALQTFVHRKNCTLHTDASEMRIVNQRTNEITHMSLGPSTQLDHHIWCPRLTHHLKANTSSKG